MKILFLIYVISQFPFPNEASNENATTGNISQDLSPFKNPSCRSFCEFESLKKHCPPETTQNFNDTTKWFFQEIGNSVQIWNKSDKNNPYHQKSNCNETCSEAQISQHKNVSSSYCSNWAKTVSSTSRNLFSSLHTTEKCSDSYVFGYKDCQNKPMRQLCPIILNHSFSQKALDLLQTIEEDTEIPPLVKLVHVLDPIEIRYSGGSKCIDICKKKLTNFEFKVRFHYPKGICRLYMAEIEDRALDPQNYQARSKVLTSDGAIMRTLYDGFSFYASSYALGRPTIQNEIEQKCEEAKNESEDFLRCSSNCNVRKLYETCPHILNSGKTETFQFDLGRSLPVEDILKEDFEDLDCLYSCFDALNVTKEVCNSFRDKFLRDSIRLTIQRNFAEKCSDGYAFVKEVYHDWSWKNLGTACLWQEERNLTERAVRYLESKRKMNELPLDVQFVYVLGSFEAKSTQLNKRFKICKKTDSNEVLKESEMKKGLCRMYLEELEAKAANPEIPRPKTKRLVEEQKTLKVKHEESGKELLNSTLCAKLCTRKLLLNNCAVPEQLYVDPLLKLYENMLDDSEIIEGVKMKNVVDNDCLEMCKISQVGSYFSEFCDAFRINALSTFSMLFEYLKMKSSCKNTDGNHIFFSDLNINFRTFCPKTLERIFDQNTLKFLKTKKENLEIPAHRQFSYTKKPFKFIYQFGKKFSKICIEKGAHGNVTNSDFEGICEMYMKNVFIQALNSREKI